MKIQNIAVDDVVLLLGKQQDITVDDTYNTENIEAFLVPAGTGVELYATNTSLCTVYSGRRRIPLCDRAPQRHEH